MATADSVKAKIQGLIDTANAKTGGSDTDLTRAVNTLLNGQSSGQVFIKADDVEFTSEHSNTTDLYAMGYNWFADLVGHVQDMSSYSKAMKPEDVLYWLGRVKYIQQGLVINDFTVKFETFATAIE